MKDWSRLIISASAGIVCLVAPAAATTYQSSQPSWHAARGLSTSTLELRDDDGDGVSERTEYSSESTYDNRGNRVLLIERFYDDGIVDRVDHTSSTYGEASRLVHELEEWDLHANGSVNIFVERWLEYDGQGNLVEERFSRSSGDRLYTETTLWQYDGAGRLIKEIFQLDAAPADGTADLVQTTTHDYNERGDLLETVFRSIPIGHQLEARALGTRPPAQDVLGEHVPRLRDDGWCKAWPCCCGRDEPQ